MDSTSQSIWQNARFKLTLWAIPSFVLPRSLVQHLFHRLLNVKCPSQVDLIRNHAIQWLGRNLDYQQLRVATAAPQDFEGLLASNVDLLHAKALIRKIQEKDFTAFWVPFIPDAECTILYIHGGGFASGSTAGCARYLVQMASELCNRGLKCSIMSVDYDLSPEAQYPTALRQISASYTFAAAIGKPVIVVGDSAGGHLCLSLLRHLHAPHPLIQAVTTSPAPEALVLVSPWVDLRNNGVSVNQNATYDCVDKFTLDRWTRQYLGPSGTLDAYTDHLNVKNTWKSVLPRTTLLIGGEYECFISDIKDLASAIENDGYEGLELLIEPLKCHAWPAVDFAFGVTETDGIESGESKDTSIGMRGLRYQVNWLVEHFGQRTK